MQYSYVVFIYGDSVPAKIIKWCSAQQGKSKRQAYMVPQKIRWNQ